MTSSRIIICGVYKSQHTTTKAYFWCPECDEGLCSQCLKHHNASKATRTQKPNHATCNGILSLENVVQTAKTSALLENLGLNINNLKISVNRVVEDLKKNLDEIQKQRQKFYDDIKQDLYAAENKVKSQIEDLLGKLAENSINVNALQKNISAIKDYASDLQALLGSKMIETEIQKHTIFMQSLFDDGSALFIESSSPLVLMKTEKEAQAQTRSLKHVPPLTINDITMTLQSKYNFPGTTGCTISSTGRTILIDYNKKRVLILKEDGTLNSDIPLSPSSSADGTCIDDKSIAVSFPFSNQIQIINILTKRVER
ncbi:unnamed protein product [Mytilus coruscus]|uniref:B box-type domain-containing protein n=1 Tax=Mytilus coruscus TaxID=42192 RepID=A0A6J8B6L6_MYTCO|nr:unnamed protein product [Mytilus coruscus]